MKNKILTLSFIIILMISLLGSKVFAEINSSKCSLNTSKNQYNVGEEIVVTFRLDELNADKGIIAYSAILDYDKEALQYVSSAGIGKWVTPSYNDENGKFIADRNDDYSSFTGEDLCTITFKALKNTTDAKIKLSEITFSNGGKQVGTHDDIEKSISITEDGYTPNSPSNPTTPDNPDTPSNPSNPSTPGNTDTTGTPSISGGSNTNNANGTLTFENTNNSTSNRTAKGIIPALGNNTNLSILIAISLIVVITLFVKLKWIDFKIKKNNE